MVPAETQSSTVVANNNILGPVESRCRDMHKVKRKETVFSISREYGISEAELIAANPELKGENKIKKGTFLCIPYPKAQTEQSIQSQAIPTDSELFRENRKRDRALQHHQGCRHPSLPGRGIEERVLPYGGILRRPADGRRQPETYRHFH